MVGGGATPRAAWPRDAYRPMQPSPTLPPVSGRFVYRPTGEPDGGGPRPGWDVGWVTPTDEKLQGRALVVSIIDSWYPPHLRRAIPEHPPPGLPPGEPRPTVLVPA